VENGETFSTHYFQAIRYLFAIWYFFVAIIAEVLLLICEMVCVDWLAAVWAAKCFANVHKEALKERIFKGDSSDFS